MDGLADRIDHIVIETVDEERLFSFLHGVLGLPTAWPLAQWGALREAGVGAGNCNIGCNHRINPAGPSAPTLTMIALQPKEPLDAVHAELGRRGLQPSEPSAGNALDLPAEAAFEPWRQGWAISVVWSGPEFPMAFFCAYAHDMDARASSEREAFEASGGGPFGITGLNAVVIRTPDPPHAARAWANLLGDGALAAEDLLRTPGGPELRLRPGEPGAGLVFGVRSLDQAASAAAERQLPHQAGPRIQLDPRGCLGLDIAFE